jgi:hypothetical protein
MRTAYRRTYAVYIAEYVDSTGRVRIVQHDMGVYISTNPTL